MVSLTVFPFFGVDVTPALKLPTGLTRIAGAITIQILPPLVLSLLHQFQFGFTTNTFDKNSPELLGIFQGVNICYFH